MRLFVVQNVGQGVLNTTKTKEMKREELIEKLRNEIDCIKDTDQIMNEASWGSEYGVLITGNDANDIITLLSLPPAEGAGYNDGISYGIGSCNAEFHVLVHDTFEEFDCLKRITKSDAQRVLGKLLEVTLGEDINPNMEYEVQQQPTAEGAEEITAEEFIREKLRQKLGIKGEMLGLWKYLCNGEDALRWAHDFATLHAQKIADKMYADTEADGCVFCGKCGKMREI